MRLGFSIGMIAACWVLMLPATRGQTAAAADIHGLVCITADPLPTPEGTTAIPLAGGDFEAPEKKPAGWEIGGKLVAAPDAPQGKAYCRFSTPRGALRTPADIPAQPGRPYLLSLWLRSAVETRATFAFTSDERYPSFFPTPLTVSSTGNVWKHLGCYCWMPVPCKTIRFALISIQDNSDKEPICVDDVRLRTATEAEMAAAYQAERAQLPARDVSPRPDDGRNLALSVAKWEGRSGIPGKPFVIWAIGSSWTHSQGDGYGLMYAIRQRFPHAPPIVYKRHAGSGTPWEFDMGWVRQFVAAEQPDLIFTYTPGTLEGLDALLAEIRRRTTADIIIPTIHFNRNANGWYDQGPLAADVTVSRERFDTKAPPTPAETDEGHAKVEAVRAICRKHQAEFVENRRELAEYHVHSGVKPNDLVGDTVHQNLHGQMLVWESISRHIARPAQFNYDPASRERRIAVAPPANTATEQVSLSGEWTASGGAVQASAAGSRLKVRFTGNRIDILGQKTSNGGSVKVFIDGQPAEQAPVFYTTFIDPDPKKLPLGGKNGAGNTAPHAVDLGTNVVPQTWTITMTSDQGDYRIEGSVTGPDGEGNASRQFHSKSGQIGIDPKLWRGVRIDKGRVICGNHSGDKFTFDVYRCAWGVLSFRAEKAAPFSEALVQNLPNREHTLEIVAAGDGPITIDGLYVFQPPEKE
jgi:hypothetical protein